MMRKWPVFFISLALPLIARDHIADIEFFGYKGVDIEAVRKALPVQPGGAYSGDTTRQVRDAVKLATGRDATDVAQVCCDDQGDLVLFVGLAGESSLTFLLNPEPTAKIGISSELAALYRRMDAAEVAAVRKGNAEEEQPSPGYRLLKDSQARELELAVRRYALPHEAELLRVLESSSDGEQRAIATDVLGYARRSPHQIAALVHASRDANDDVRNNATRALGELVGAGTGVAKQIGPDTYIDMIRSNVWTDRNKASFLLLQLTRSRDPHLLARLRAEASDALIEMALWRDRGHALPARIILGRIAGIPELKLVDLANSQPQAIVDALATSR
jgi:hypothetical protein